MIRAKHTKKTTTSDSAKELRFARAVAKTADERGRRLKRIVEIITTVENRCMAADIVTNTRHEMTDDELREIYVLAGGKIHGER